MNFHDGDYYGSDSSSSSSEEEFNVDDFQGEGASKPASNSNDPVSQQPKPSSSLWSRTILHLDVDCFYAQCEELEHPEYKHRPIAIGQKHIIVTSNYVARNQYGVRKLQLKSDAIKQCPSLLIVDGSDLTRYRQYSRKIYKSFRECVKELPCEKDGVDSTRKAVAVRKGGMDELFADISALVDASTVNDQSQSLLPAPPLPANAFVYGDNNNKHSAASQSISITEDQSGARATVAFDDDEAIASSSHSSFYNAHVQYGNSKERQDCQRRLYAAAHLCETIRQSIHQSTGFTTTIGISVSPMLAKLSSDLHKPNSLNVLLPWRSSSIVLPMPLRKVPELGSRTLKALSPCLERVHCPRKPDFWTCR
jgi:DNA polymerase iota